MGSLTTGAGSDSMIRERAREGGVGSHLGVRIWNFDPKKPSNGFILNLCCNRKLDDKICH
jgi:hypothetical protein